MGSIFDNYKIRYEVTDEAGEKNIHFNTFGFLKEGMLRHIYKNYPNWKVVKAWWDEKNAPFGYLENNEHTKTLVEKQVQKKDWTYLPENDFEIIARIWFKIHDEYVEEKIKKSYLIKGFMDHLYDKYGDKWNLIETFFEDTGKPAYDLIENTKYREKNRTISVTTLKILRRSLNKKKFQEEKRRRKNSLYLLYFIQRKYFKIGNTTNLKFRILSYLYPYTDSEKYFYEDTIIDFEKSFIIPNLDDNQLEQKLKRKFKKFRYFTEGHKYKSTEIFSKECLEQVLLGIPENQKT